MLVFSGIGSIDFSECWDRVREPYEVARDRAGFFGKNFLPLKLGKWAKNSVFCI